MQHQDKVGRIWCSLISVRLSSLLQGVQNPLRPWMRFRGNQIFADGSSSLSQVQAKWWILVHLIVSLTPTKSSRMVKRRPWGQTSWAKFCHWYHQPCNFYHQLLRPWFLSHWLGDNNNTCPIQQWWGYLKPDTQTLPNQCPRRISKNCIIFLCGRLWVSFTSHNVYVGVSLPSEEANFLSCWEKSL